MANAPRITAENFVDDLFGGSRKLCVAHFEQYAPLVRKLLVEHIFKCATNKY
jgi:hypothetical protein